MVKPAQFLSAVKVAIALMDTAATVESAAIEMSIALVYSTPQPNVMRIQNVEVIEHRVSVKVINVPAAIYLTTVPVIKTSSQTIVVRMYPCDVMAVSSRISLCVQQTVFETQTAMTDTVARVLRALSI